MNNRIMINNENRNYTLDILKVISLLGIVMAHVNPNKIIF